jgi:hypothetical protein
MPLFLVLLSLVAFAEDSSPAEAPAEAPATAPLAPVVQIKAVKGQRFSVIIDGQPLGVAAFDAPLTLIDLAPGMHTAEFRTEDRLVIWARGLLDLQASDQIVLTLTEGRPVMASGRTGAWRVASSTTALPRRAVKQPVREVP